MNKREFLKSSFAALSTVGISQTLPSLSRAQIMASKNIEFIYQIHISGGWDVTLSTDTFDSSKYNTNSFFIEYKNEDRVRVGSLALGPAIQPLKNYFKEMCVVNGVVQRTDSGHESLGRYIMSGRGDGSLPLFSYENSFVNPTLMGLISSNSFYRASVSSPVFGTSGNRDFSDLIDYDNNLEPAIVIERDPARLKELKKLLSVQPQLLQASKELSEIYSKDASLRSELDATAFLAFKYGWANSAFLETFMGNLDTHTNHPNAHRSGLTGEFERVNKLIKLSQEIPYKNGTVYDKTLFIITSEMSRTPALNGSNGKDHNPYSNSYIFIGKSVKGSQAIGASHLISAEKSASGLPVHMGLPYDRKTKKVVTNKEKITATTSLIFPENVMKSLYQQLGMKTQVAQHFSNVWGLEDIFKS